MDWPIRVSIYLEWNTETMWCSWIGSNALTTQKWLQPVVILMHVQSFDHTHNEGYGQLLLRVCMFKAGLSN